MKKLNKLMVGIGLAAVSAVVYASCTTTTVISDGTVKICTTCCYGNQCQTTCY